jgi:hypothetical protein
MQRLFKEGTRRVKKTLVMEKKLVVSLKRLGAKMN